MQDSKTAAPVERCSSSLLRRSLVLSQRESVFSSVTTGSFDQYVNAFAIYLGASAVQIGWLTALPQLVGGVAQLASVWVGQWIHRHWLIVLSAVAQCLSLLLVMLLAFPGLIKDPLSWLILALCFYHITANLIMPHWRAWMGQLVPDQIRGRFFGLRSRIGMLTAFLTFLFGGGILALAQQNERDWLGFITLFGMALLGRSVSTVLLARMHDDHSLPTVGNRHSPLKSIQHFRELWNDRTFRRFSLFSASMSCFVAVSGPFFAVYMLRDLSFTYTQFTLCIASSILTQFLLLKFWGHVCDIRGNRYVMALGASVIPVLPVLWLFSDNFYYIIMVQVISGTAWSGFTLASANYLYDQKPRDVHFASYAALHSSLSAFAVCLGAISGGYLIQILPEDVSLGGLHLQIERPIAVIFILSALLRASVVFWYIPTAPELRVKTRGRVRDLAFRVARFTPISGVMLDVINRRRRKTD